MKYILPEIVSIGIYNSKITSKGTKITKHRKTAMFEIELPIETDGTAYINSEEMPLRSDMVICAKPGQTRCTKLPLKCYYIHMIVKEGKLYDILMDTPNFVKTDKYEYYLELFKKLCKYHETALENDELILHSLILELIYNLMGDSQKLFSREKSKSNHHEMIDQVTHYIKNNLTSDLSLAALAAYSGFSMIHFHNCFKLSTGQTLREYVEDQRIRKATHLLTTTSNTLTEIAYQCGFSSQSYFSYAFKRRMKLTPREYSQRISQQYEK